MCFRARSYSCSAKETGTDRLVDIPPDGEGLAAYQELGPREEGDTERHIQDTGRASG
jgi:hypothetical protein